MATAYAALVSLQNNLRLIRNHPRHSFSFEDEQFRSLWEIVRFFVEFMKSFDDSHGAIKEAAEALESRIARAVQAAEDIVESHVVDQIHGGSTLRGKRRSRFLLDLQKAIQDMDYMRRKAINVQKLQGRLEVEQPKFSATASKVRMVGSDDQLRLLDLLTKETASRQVISIVGMGGIGKTTLAKNAIQDPRCLQYFDFCLWATVSQEFITHKILSELLSNLLSQVNGHTFFVSDMPDSSVDDLGRKIYRSLYGRRYLIILDDMWSVEAWNEIQFFPDTNNDSRIVVTTRQSNVAHHLNFRCLHMILLDKDSSWDLFCQETFEEHCCPPELEDIGEEIVERCKGLPLAIVVIAGHLKKSSRSIVYWEYVAKNMSLVLNSSENEECLNILSLSYRHLPIDLKPCFLFLGLYPKYQEIRVSELISLWIGDGFIHECGNCNPEYIAWDYLLNLVQRNLVSMYEKPGKFGYHVWVCRVHDLLRELCLKIAKKDEFFIVVDTRQAIKRERRVIIKGKFPKVNHQSKRSAPVIRS